MFSRIKKDLESVMKHDPAARNRFEVVLTYSGFHALVMYRFAHFMHVHGYKLIARIVAQTAKFFTGIEIHPGAKIGSGVFIDHGEGVVIGETAVVGNNVVIYQGVTLGGTGKDKGKRHPTLGNNVMVGSGAKVLGPFTVGDNARIAAGAVVLSAVPEDCTAVGVPAHVVRVAGKIATFADEVDQISVRDPVEEKLNAALSRLEFLEKLMDEQYLKSRREESAGSET